MKQNKFLALFCAAALVLGLALPVYAAFPDVAGDWSEPAVEAMTQRGILSGYRDGTFRPGDWVTRAEAAKMVSLAVDTLPYTLPSDGTGDFNDLAGHWARNNIRQLVVENIIEPSEYGASFGPNTRATRLEMIRMLMRMLGFSPADKAVGSSFTDLSSLGASDRYYCEKAVQIGLINGYSDGLFRPNFPLSRGEAAAMLQRALPRQSVALAGLRAYEEDNTIPRAEQFIPVVAGSTATGEGEYQGSPMHLYRYDLDSGDKTALQQGIDQYLQVLAAQRYSLVEAEATPAQEAYLLCDLRGSRAISLAVRQKDPDTKKPSLTIGIFENRQATSLYTSYIDALGVSTICKRWNLAPARFSQAADPAGGQSPTEVYDESLLPGGMAQHFIDDLLAAGYQKANPIEKDGVTTQVFRLRGATVYLASHGGQLTIQLAAN